MDVSEILAELDDHGFADTSTTRKMAEINDAYFDACSRHAWPFLMGTGTANYTNTTNTITVPADVEKIISLTNQAGRIVRPIRAETFYRDLITAQGATGTAKYWFKAGSTYFIWPNSSSTSVGILLY